MIEDLANPSITETEGSAPATEPRDYRSEFDRVMLLVQCAADLPIDIDFIDTTLSRAESIGPILDPTAFMRGARNLEEQREIMRLVEPFIRGARQIVAKHKARKGNAA